MDSALKNFKVTYNSLAQPRRGPGEALAFPQEGEYLYQKVQK